MPFKSQAQRRKFYADPKLRKFAPEWEAATPPGLKSGIESLDAYTLGFRPQEMIVIGGRPSMGKTAFAMGIAAQIAMTQQLPVGVFSLEMSREQLTKRLLAVEGLLPLNSVLAPRYIGHDAVSAMRLAAQKLRQAPLEIDDSSGMTMREIRAKGRRLKRRHPNLALLVIDYAQLVQGSERDMRERMTMISHGIKALARELEIPIIALSQLTRDNERNQGKQHARRPKLSDLRETGAWEEDADVVLLVHRDTRDADEAEIIVAKQRNGRTGHFDLAYCKEQTRFAEMPKTETHAQEKLPF